MGKCVFHVGISVVVFAGQHLKKQAVEVVVTSDALKIEEGIRGVSVIIGKQLGFEQFEEQNPIDPGDGQFERHVEQAVLRGAAKLI